MTVNYLYLVLLNTSVGHLTVATSEILRRRRLERINLQQPILNMVCHFNIVSTPNSSLNTHAEQISGNGVHMYTETKL